MRPRPRCDGRGQRGLAALELALILPACLVLLVFPLYLGRVLWHYGVMQRAAQDAARYLSTVPLSEMKSTSRAPLVVAIASDIVAEEMAELTPGSSPYALLISCNGGEPCAGTASPTSVKVAIVLSVEDIFFAGYSGMALPLAADVTYPYLGR